MLFFNFECVAILDILNQFWKTLDYMFSTLPLSLRKKCREENNREFKMQELIAPTENTTFNVELALDQQVGAQPLPFPGMDKSGAAVCRFFIADSCVKGIACPFRHVSGDKTVVCKHWLRGLCKKGDECEFLHEYDLTKMPECFFYSKFNACSNRECPFLHIDPNAKIKDCPWYDRGFCRHGPNCKHRHTKRVMCINYMCGFCPEGPNCKKAHPCFDVPTLDQLQNLKKTTVICHNCQEVGHKIYYCPQLPAEERQRLLDEQRARHQVSFNNPQRQGPPDMSSGNTTDPSPFVRPPRTEFVRRPLGEVTCYKCGEKGHFANRCPKGHLAFLSAALQNQPPPSQSQQNYMNHNQENQ